MNQQFTAHNIRLDDGTQTLPSAISMEKTPIFKAVHRTLDLIYRGDLKGTSVADIGYLEGGYATEFARLGMEATGIEVRKSNMQCCLHVKQNVDLQNLSFLQDDAMNIGQHGPFDVLFVCGLLYHLDRPRRFLEEASRVCRRAIFLETHFSPLNPDTTVNTYNLGEIEMNEGLKGRWYSEHDAPAVDKLEALRWSSWSNARSFWICKTDLLQTLYDSGFDLVLEQFDCESDIASQYTMGRRSNTSRALLVGIRSDVK
jgi:2-polyprenyl-3-methyl-5-hydroxy-6-metoxy-1,4-benzoquinol methylase